MPPEIQTALLAVVVAAIGALTLFIPVALSNRGRLSAIEVDRAAENLKRDAYVTEQARKADARDQDFRRLEETRRLDIQASDKLVLEVGALRSKLEIADREALARDARILFLMSEVDKATRENTGLRQIITDLTAANERLTRQLEEIPLLQARVERLEKENKELRELWTSLQPKPT